MLLSDELRSVNSFHQMSFSRYDRVLRHGMQRLELLFKSNRIGSNNAR
jgi:hypothetical protein